MFLEVEAGYNNNKLANNEIHSVHVILSCLPITIYFASHFMFVSYTYLLHYLSLSSIIFEKYRTYHKLVSVTRKLKLSNLIWTDPCVNILHLASSLIKPDHVAGSEMLSGTSSSSFWKLKPITQTAVSLPVTHVNSNVPSSLIKSRTVRSLPKFLFASWFFVFFF